MTTTTKSLLTGAAIAAGAVTTYLVMPSEPKYLTVAFDNDNDQPVSAIIESTTNLMGKWKLETNFVAQVGSNGWRDYDINQPAKFYRVNFGWWY